MDWILVGEKAPKGAAHAFVSVREDDAEYVVQATYRPLEGRWLDNQHQSITGKIVAWQPIDVWWTPGSRMPEPYDRDRHPTPKENDDMMGTSKRPR